MGPPPRRRTEAEALEDVSARMLQGWKMLGDSCPMPACNTPLVESRRGEVWCARCGAAVLRAPPAGASLPPAPPPAPTPKEAHDAAVRAWNGDDDDDDDEFHDVSEPEVVAKAVVAAPEAPPAPRFAAKYKKRDDASAAIGRKLLQGWTLLDAPCPRDGCVGCPLMKDGRDPDARRYCVSCEAYEDDEPAEPSAPSSPESAVLVEKTFDSPPPAPAAVDNWRDFVVREDDTAVANWRDFVVEDRSAEPLGSDVLGKHLLLGWAMLGDICPNPGCNSPLMRAPGGKPACVQPGCAKVAAPAPEKAAPAPEEEAVVEEETAPRCLPCPAPPIRRAAPSGDGDDAVVFARASAALLGKVADTAAWLSDARGPAAVAACADAVAACAGALGAVRACKDLYGDDRARAAEDARDAVRARLADVTFELGEAEDAAAVTAAANAVASLSKADAALTALV